MKRIRKIGTGAAVTWILLAALTACAAAQDQGQRPFTKPFHSIIPAENRSDSISPDSVSPKLKSEGTALAYSLVAMYKALGGGWQIREGKDFVPEQIRVEMAQRTDWGKLLSLEEQKPPPEADRKLWRSPDW